MQAKGTKRHGAESHYVVVWGAPCRQQLWWQLLDMMDSEAVRLRNLLGFAERGPLMDAKDESQASDAGEEVTNNRQN